MPTSAVSTRPHVVVVGGGIAGLAAALGVLDGLPTAEVTVLEGSDRLGGKLRLEPVAGHLVDVGAESLLAVRPEAVALAGRVGAGDDVVAPSTTSAAVWSRGALRPLPRATLMGVPTDPDSARGVLTDDEVARLRDEQEWPGGALQEDVAVGEYVATRLGQAVVDRLVEPLLGGVYAGHASRLSLRATLPTLWDTATRGESLLAAPASPARQPPAHHAPRSPVSSGESADFRVWLPTCCAPAVRPCALSRSFAGSSSLATGGGSFSARRRPRRSCTPTRCSCACRRRPRGGCWPRTRRRRPGCSVRSRRPPRRS